MATETEESKIIKELGADLHKSIKGLEEKVKEQGDARDLIKALDTQLEKLKDNPDKIKDLTERVEEVIVKMNNPNFGSSIGDTSRNELEGHLKKSLEGKDFKHKGDTASFKWDGGNRGLQKAAGTITNASFTDGSGNAVAVNPEYSMQVVGSPVRKVHMSSILTQTPMGGDLFTYPQYAGDGEGDFETQTVQGASKAQIEAEFEMINLIPSTVAGFYRVAKQNLADIPWLLQSLLSEGAERYKKAEDRKILYGPGGNDIKGIDSFATLFTGDMPNYYEAVLNPIFELLDNDHDPNAILLRPSAYAWFLKNKTSTGEYNFPMLFVPNQIQPMNIAGVPIFMSTAVKPNEAFVGDFSGNNIQIRVREGLSIDFAYEDADNFTKNLVTIRIESRIGLQVNHLDAFMKVNFANITPVI